MTSASSSRRACHYCGKTAVVGRLTKDHIVPRFAVRALRLPSSHVLYGMNLVPACQPCNGEKGSLRSSCRCLKCRRAWDTYIVLVNVIGNGKMLVAA